VRECIRKPTIAKTLTASGFGKRTEVGTKTLPRFLVVKEDACPPREVIRVSDQHVAGKIAKVEAPRRMSSRKKRSTGAHAGADCPQPSRSVHERY
jgi:hypothetical protein